MNLLRLLPCILLLAVVTRSELPINAPLGFRTQINVLNSMQAPYTGALVFKVNASGVLTGEYQADSIRPDPLYGQLVPVTGTISGNRIMLQIGNGMNAFSVNGTVNRQTITGSANQRGRIWTFTAVRVHLRKPPVTT